MKNNESKNMYLDLYIQPSLELYINCTNWNLNVLN